MSCEKICKMLLDIAQRKCVCFPVAENHRCNSQLMVNNSTFA